MEVNNEILQPSASVRFAEDSSSSDDEDASLRDISRLKESSIRRNDSYTSFLTRSQRNLLLGKDQPPSQEEEAQRSVHFKADLEVVHEIPGVEEYKLDFDKIWMTSGDFDRVEADMKITMFRWENHLSGKIAFDHHNNTMRGLEHLDREKQSVCDMARYKHRQAVLGEIQRQIHDNGAVTDWEKVRQAAEAHSVENTQKALETAKQDEMASRNAWNKGVVAEEIPDTPRTRKKKKKKFLFF